jgi:UrcA family protein
MDMVNGIARTAVSVALSAAFSTAIALAPAIAATPVADGMSTTVRTSDLDLSTDAGVKMLNARVSRAAGHVCGDASSQDLEIKRQVDLCRKVALNSAAPQVQLAVAAAHSNKRYAFVSLSKPIPGE